MIRSVTNGAGAWWDTTSAGWLLAKTTRPARAPIGSLLRLARGALRRGNDSQAIELNYKGQALQNEVGDTRGLTTSDSLLGRLACYQGHSSEAATLLDESRRRGKELWGVEAAIFIANYQGPVAYYRDDAAAALWERGLVA